MTIYVNSTASRLLSQAAYRLPLRPFRPCPNARRLLLCHNAIRFSLCPITNASVSARMFSLCPITNDRRLLLCSNASRSNARRLLLCSNARMFSLPHGFLTTATAMRVHTGTNCFFINPKPKIVLSKSYVLFSLNRGLSDRSYDLQFDHKVPVYSLNEMINNGKLQYDYPVYWNKTDDMMETKSKALRFATTLTEWFDMWHSNLKDNDIDSYVIEYMKSAKEPFQFMRKALLTLKGGCFEAEPVFMDASSSAYQIMGYLLQDTEIAFQTNLINGFTREDLYTNLREDYLKYLRESNNIVPRLEPFFTRKLIKRIFMPITYGKTVKAIADDLYEVLWKQISYKSCMILGKESFKFWCIRYRELHNLLKLFGGIGYLCSSLGRAVKLSTPLFYSYQDYRKFEKQSVWVYSNKKSKDKRTRHKLSFNVLTTKRNVLKSKCATFANFIHQKDALVAINTIRSFYNTYEKNPIYTVHDCFVSNYEMSEKMADIYKETLFKSLGNPMELINMFLFYNLIAPNYPNYMISDYADDRLDFMIHTPINPVSHCLSKSDPIPVEHLKSFVQKWINVKVKSLGVAKTKIFEERANEVIECYNNYVRSLCGRVIERVYGNTDFAKELIDQRNAIKNRMFQFRDICFNKPGKNYSLT